MTPSSLWSRCHKVSCILGDMTVLPEMPVLLTSLAIILASLLAALPLACPDLHAANASTSASLPRAELPIPLRNGPPVKLHLEVADTVAARARGLMFRKRLAPDEGMLLLWKKPRRVAIWMKNTYVPLDIVFIGPDWRIVRIHENARPLDLSLIPSRKPVRAVLEIHAGMARRLGLAPGMRLRPRWISR